jgi:hypothetical protein
MVRSDACGDIRFRGQFGHKTSGTNRLAGKID